MSASVIVRKSMRAHRDDTVIKSWGMLSARITNVVDAGGSSNVLSSRAAPSADNRWNSWRIMTFRSLSTGAREAPWMISAT